MKRLFTFESMALFIICLVMLNNVDHLAWVHYSISRHDITDMAMDRLHSILVVVIVELSIILFAHRGHHVFAGFFTVMLFALQLIYYPLDQYWENGQYGKFMAAVIYSCLFTISIYYFAVMRARLQQNAAEQQQFEAKWCEAARELSKAQGIINKLQHELSLGKDDANKIAAIEMDAARKVQQLEKELKELRMFKQQVVADRTCKYCNQEFESEASKRSHEGRCKENRKAA